MNIDDANALVKKGMSVILSCKTLGQLQSAICYANLIYRQISKEIGFANRTKFTPLIERSIGFAQCQIKANTALD